MDRVGTGGGEIVDTDVRWTRAFDPFDDAGLVAPPLGNAVVMVVDDDPTILALVGSMLSQRSYEVLRCSSGAMALGVAARTPPDLALIDVMMPGMDGFAVCRQLRDMAATVDIPVLFMSALEDTDDKAQAFSEGGVDYMTKPFGAHELLARVETHLTLHRSRQRLRDREVHLEELVQHKTTEIAASKRALEQRNVQLASLIATLPDLVWLKDLDGVYLDCNPRVEALVGAPGSAIVGRTDAELFDPEYARATREQERLVVDTGAASTNEHWVLFDDGHRELLETTRTPLRDLDGSLIGVLGIGHDVTERRAYEQTLEVEQARVLAALEAAQAATWEWNLVTEEVRYTDRWAQLLGYDLDDLDATTAAWRARLHPDDRPDVLAALDPVLAGTEDRLEVEYRTRNGDGAWVWLRTLGRVMQRTSGGRPVSFVGIDIDISSQREHQQELDFAANHDGLTGLFNRQRFTQRLRDRLARRSDLTDRLLVVTLDLDDFDAINRAYARSGGNQLLVEIAHRLITLVDDRDDVARIGGDEFAVILDVVDEDWHAPVVRLLEVIADPVRLLGRELVSTASVGVTLFPQPHEVDADQLLRQADQAVYQAKLAGKNRWHLFDTHDDESSRDRYQRIDEIRTGLQAQQFVLFYQPKVNMHTGVIDGFEALIRWQHPERGLLPPGAFIPALADHPLSIEVGDWVIEQALTQVAAWKRRGMRTKVSVNVDAMQLHDPGFADRLARQLGEQPTVEPEQLQIEILETGALQNMARIAALVTDLRSTGVGVALDDFGTGFSSLTFLRELAADTIKIDRSFVIELLDDPDRAVIVDSILGLARRFGRKVVAEGVETDDHGQLLLELGCELGQGYGIARPMPAEDVDDWVAAWQAPDAWRATAALGTGRTPDVLADVQHRAWQHQVLAHLDGGGNLEVETDGLRCELGRWLATSRMTGRIADRDCIDHIADLHGTVHALAVDALEADADADQRRRATDELRAASNALLDAMRSWRQAAEDA